MNKFSRRFVTANKAQQCLTVRRLRRIATALCAVAMNAGGLFTRASFLEQLETFMNYIIRTAFPLYQKEIIDSTWLSHHSEIIEFLGHKGEGEGFVDARGGSAVVRGTELLEIRAFSVLYLSVNNPSPSGVKL